jgi:hypothetical protein
MKNKNWVAGTTAQGVKFNDGSISTFNIYTSPLNTNRGSLEHIRHYIGTDGRYNPIMSVKRQQMPFRSPVRRPQLSPAYLEQHGFESVFTHAIKRISSRTIDRIFQTQN